MREASKHRVWKSSSHERYRKQNLAYSALLGVAVVSVVQLVSLDELSTALRVSIVSFSLSIPLLATSAYIIFLSRKYEYGYEVETQGTRFASIAGILLVLLGIDTIFWHLWWLAGGLFIVSSGSAFAIFLYYYLMVLRANVAEIKRDAGHSDEEES